MKIALKELMASINAFIEKACVRESVGGKLLCRRCGAGIEYQRKALPMEFPSIQDSDKTEPMLFTISRIPYCPRCLPESDSAPPFQHIEAVIVGQ